MEKVTYPLLIEHLKEQGELYEQLCKAHELKFGRIDHRLISYWIVNRIEPIVEAITASAPEHLPQVFKAFFTELLQLIGRKSAVLHESEYAAAWKLTTLIPELFKSAPSRILEAIDSAVSSIRTYQPENVMSWISLMENAAGACKTTDEFLSVGRICAWRSGMAHLRTRAKEEHAQLRPELAAHLKTSCEAFANIEETLKNQWQEIKSPAFITAVGGFIGHGGPFKNIPKVAQIDNNIFITDQYTSCALYADRFGTVLIKEISVLQEGIAAHAHQEGWNTFRSKYGNRLITFDDLHSSVLSASSFIFTRTSSHYVYIYAWS